MPFGGLTFFTPLPSLYSYVHSCLFRGEGLRSFNSSLRTLVTFQGGAFLFVSFRPSFLGEAYISRLCLLVVVPSFGLLTAASSSCRFRERSYNGGKIFPSCFHLNVASGKHKGRFRSCFEKIEMVYYNTIQFSFLYN